MLSKGDIVGGKYSIVRELGHGGMGAVLEGVHLELDKPVAIKVLLEQEDASGEDFARFYQEAWAAAKVGHRGIIDVYDVGVTKDENPYIVMELLRGENLEDHLERRGQLDVEFAAYIGCQVLSALAAMHDVGIVHRDLKPANIFLVETGALLPDVKVLDFGISRILKLDTGETATRMTRSGAIMGTPCYMSPEQVRGFKDIDRRTDLFTLGVILFEALTGSLPINADTVGDLMVQIVIEEPPPLRTLRTDIPESVEQVVLRALEKEREKRFQLAKEMFDVLLPFVDKGALSMLPMPSGNGGDTDKDTPPVSIDAFAKTGYSEAGLDAPGSLAEPASVDITPPFSRNGSVAQSGRQETLEQPRRNRSIIVALVVLAMLALGGVLSISFLLFVFDGDDGIPVDPPTPAEVSPVPGHPDGMGSPRAPAETPEVGIPSAEVVVGREVGEDEIDRGGGGSPSSSTPASPRNGDLREHVGPSTPRPDSTSQPPTPPAPIPRTAPVSEPRSPEVLEQREPARPRSNPEKLPPPVARDAPW